MKINGIELRQLICNCDFEPRWENYELGDLRPNEVRVKSELTAAKHGTEKSEISGNSSHSKMPYLHDRKVFDRSQKR